MTAPSPQMQSFQIFGMSAGPMGHVAVGSNASSSTSSTARCAVYDASGTLTASPSQNDGSGSSAAYVAPKGFDPSDGLLYAFGHQNSTPNGMAVNGFTGEAVTKSVTGLTGMGPNIGTDFLGATAAGDLFARVSVFPTGTVDFGLGPRSGTVMLHYDPAGKLVSDTLPIAGTPRVGALGHLFYARQSSGPADDGCGMVGAPSMAQTILTKRDAMGACLWSKALPASTLFALDPAENVLLATTFAGTVDFGGGPLASAGTSDLALAKLGPSGNPIWSERFGASGASVSGLTGFGATNDGGAGLAVGIDGAVDFGCGAVSSSTGANTLFARFDASGAVVYSRVVGLLAGFNGSSHAGPAVDGLGGISYAVQVKYQANCACTSPLQCQGMFDMCFMGMCQQCVQASFAPGDILITRFAP